MIDNDKIIKDLEKKLMTFGNDPKTQNVGTVEEISDIVVIASGLSHAEMGEEIEFADGSLGVVLGLSEDTVSIVMLRGGDNLRQGDSAKRTGKLLSIGASDDLLGRVVNPLGAPLDGKNPIKAKKQMPLERIAAGVVDREPVDTPMKTGIKAIDSMIPIGRGQRELIIGDRGLGKTSIALDTILNQKNQVKGRKRVICVYVAIGQKQSTIAQVVDRLKSEGSMEYSIVVAASASDPASLQYLAPYAGVSIAEYFMEKGEDVLVVFDDLTKQAWAYRQLSLVLRRPAGREAYPGDIFYLHSRLLERAVKLNKKLGGGSITALPIIETQAGDKSAYIPTNVISITDGQIFVEADLFNNGIRPAIDAGGSVSRVGGAAQTGAMKSVSGQLRLEIAQYNSLAAFAQFGSDLDKETVAQLERGKRVTQILVQPQYHPLPEPLEVFSIWAVTNGHMDDIPVNQIQKFETQLHQFLQTKYKKLLEQIAAGDKLKDDVTGEMKKAVEEFKKGFST